MHRSGINGEGELREQPANSGSPGKMAYNRGVCVCMCVCQQGIKVTLSRYQLLITERQCRVRDLIENDVSATLQDEIFVVKNVDQSTRSCNHDLQLRHAHTLSAAASLV